MAPGGAESDLASRAELALCDCNRQIFKIHVSVSFAFVCIKPPLAFGQTQKRKQSVVLLSEKTSLIQPHFYSSQDLGRNVTILSSTHTYAKNHITFLLSFNYTSFGSLQACLRQNVILQKLLKRSSLSWYWNVYKHRAKRLP